MAATTDQTLLTPPARDRDALERVSRLLATDDTGTLALVGRDGVPVPLPPALEQTLRQAVVHLARDRAVSVVPVARDLTTQQAADLLNVSRPYLVRLLDEGTIPSSRTGTHRRVRLDDLMAYRALRDTKRQEGLRRLKEMSEEWGLYDAE